MIDRNYMLKEAKTLRLSSIGLIVFAALFGGFAALSIILPVPEPLAEFGIVPKLVLFLAMMTAAIYTSYMAGREMRRSEAYRKLALEDGVV